MNTALAVGLFALIVCYSLKIILKWGWMGVDGVMRFIAWHWPRRSVVAEYPMMAMSSAEKDDPPPFPPTAQVRASNLTPNSNPAPNLSPEPSGKLAITQFNAVIALARKGFTQNPGSTALSDLDLYRLVYGGEESVVKHVLLAYPQTKTVLAKAMGGTYDDQRDRVASIAATLPLAPSEPTV